MAIWSKDSKIIVDENGKVIVCNNCPCGGIECREAVDAQVEDLLAEIDPETQAHVWALYGTFEPDYTCAQWHYDSENEEWVLDAMATGKLAIALQYGNIVTDTTNCTAYKFTYAKVLYSVSRHMYRTIGCECHVSDHECKHTKTVRDDYCIAGELDVWQPDQSDSSAIYEPSKACEVDPCKLLKLKMETAHYWHGGQMYGEGYYDDWKSHSRLEEDYDYTAFKMAIKWELESSDSESNSQSTTPIYNLTYIDCSCSAIYSFVMASDVTCLEYAGVCTMEHPCKPLMFLHWECVQNDWIWHDEGVLVHLEHVKYLGVDYFGDWYAWREVDDWTDREWHETDAFTIHSACAETPDRFYVISHGGGDHCACTARETHYKAFDHELPTSETNPANYRMYLDMAGICNCNSGDCTYPDRELLMAYPDVFGVLETCYGNHAKFNWTRDYYETDRVEDEYGNVSNVTYHYEKYGCDILGQLKAAGEGTGKRTMYIDYRALGVITKALRQNGDEGVRVRVCYPDGSEGREYYKGYYWCVSAPTFSGYGSGTRGLYDTATFTGGYWQPFTRDMEIGQTTIKDGVIDPDFTWYGQDAFTGWTHAWRHSNDSPYDYGAKINGCQPTETCDYDCTSESEARNKAGCSDSAPTPCIGVDVSSASNWDKAALLSPDFTVVMQQDCSTRRVQPDPDYQWFYYYCYTQKWFTVGANVGECAWYLLNVNYVHTNKGLIVKGLGGFHETYTLLGASNYPEYTGCWSEECKNPRIDPISGEISDPCHWLDEVEECPADEDMHSCLGWTDWGDESDSSSDSNSSSESVSDSESTSVSEGV